MTKAIGFIALAVLGGAMILVAAADVPVGPTAARKMECERQADAKEFGIHQHERHRFVIRCIAGLLQR